MLLHRRHFAVVAYLFLGFAGGFLMVFASVGAGVGVPQNKLAQSILSLSVFHGLPGTVSGWVFWLVAVRPLRQRLEREAGIVN